MAYIAPTFAALKARIEQDLSALVPMLRLALAVVFSKAVSSLHVHLEWIDQQCSPLTCSLERLYDWAVLYGVTRLDATFATGQIAVTGNVGAFVLLDELLRADNGLDYAVTAAVELTSGVNLVSIKCTTAGLAGNLSAGSKLTFVELQAGVDSETTVDANGITGGAAQEDVETWRARVVDEWQVVTEYGGRSGKNRDYVAWAKKAHPSVTGALVYRNILGIGTILVRPICNGLEGRLPTTAIMDAIAAKFLELAPAGADWRLALPLQQLVTVNLTLNPAVDSEANRALITNAINNLILAENSETSVIYQAELDAAIASVTTQYTRNAPLDDITVNSGSVFILNAVVFS
ncbi:baseplate J/gp47 family protein [Methylophilus sp. DW102]|uniref:baseplate J/gp47 family protein n=1 Tax=Methylophilus sp. DW102 TaxID=3095607 RepID=UPI00308AC461|nr:baseplate J/gp47 family protein [Methylophilus sp. DW102]BEV09308.1 baseplate J/gp47 family protein [Methylophilus sp. DW102]